MRIAVFHDLRFGGPRRVANELAKRLKKKHKVDLYILSNAVQAEEYNFFSNVYFYKFLSEDYVSQNWQVKLYTYTIRLWKLFFLHKKISKSINRRNYDVVIVYSSRSLQAPFLLRFLMSKKIYYCHEISHKMYDPVIKYRKSERPIEYLFVTFARFMERYINGSNSKFADMVMVNSRFLKKELMKFYKIKSEVCPPGVDDVFFSPQKIKRDIDILFIGSMDYEKGEYTLFKNAIHFVNRDLKVKAIIGEKKWISDLELRESYRKAKLVICTTHYEPFGLVPLEAGACETPVIAVDEGGYRETIIHNKTGYLVKRNPIKIGNAIGKALENTSQLRRFGSYSRKNIGKVWKWEMSVNKFESLLNECVTKN